MQQRMPDPDNREPGTPAAADNSPGKTSPLLSSGEAMMQQRKHRPVTDPGTDGLPSNLSPTDC